MDKATHRSNESTISTTGTLITSPLSDTIENVKYMNLNFMDNSESSSQAKEHSTEYSKHERLSYEMSTKITKPAPCKILPFNIPGKVESAKIGDSEFKEKSLADMGFKSNEIDGWENIVQPAKQNLYKLLRNMIDNHIKPNVQIRIGGVTFNCHMMVLQCYSDFFMDCNNEVLIQLPEEKITPGAFMMVYDWMLAEEPLVQREGILELFNAANFLRIRDLINQCWLCLDDDVRFREDTAFMLYLEARIYNLEALEQLMLTRICKFFLTLVSSKEFLELNHKEICTLLGSNSIGVNSEVEIFMSIVRWLNHNWEEREKYLLDVVKCVRFSLMPPWFLVTLGKNTECDRPEFDHIVNHTEVQRMISDGISYTTTQLYYSENREEFLHFLERYQLVAPMQRQWVFDKECSYHHRLECPNMQYVTYKSFLEYLEMIQTVGKDYWRSLEMAKTVGKTWQCCARSDCRKMNQQNLATIYTKTSRDQGIQVDSRIKVRKKSSKDQKTATKKRNRINQSNDVVVDNATNNDQEQLNSLRMPSFINITDCVSEQTDEYSLNRQYNQTKEQQKQQQQQQHQQPENQFSCKNKLKDDSKEAALANELNCLYVKHKLAESNGNHKKEQEQIQHQHHQQQQKQHDRNKNQDKSAIIKTEPNKWRGSSCTCRKDDLDADKKMVEAFRQHVDNGGGGGGTAEAGVDKKPDEYIVSISKQPAKLTIASINLNEFNLITNKKILIFGGVDPYCNHCLYNRAQPHTNDKHAQQQLQQQKLHLKQQQQQQQQQQAQYKNKKIMLHVSAEEDNGHVAADGNVCTMDDGNIAATTTINDNVNYGDQVLFYDANNKQWKHLSYIPFGSRHHHAATLCNGLIYVIGGTRVSLECKRKSIFQKSVWCFDPHTFTWTYECNLPELRRDFAVIAIDNEIYSITKCCKELGIGFFVIGGEGVKGKALDTVWFYDVKRKIWIKKASLNVGRYGLAAVIVNNEIWIAGGIIDGRKTLSYSTVSGAGSGIDKNDDEDDCAHESSDVDEERCSETRKTPMDVITDTIEYYNLRCNQKDYNSANTSDDAICSCALYDGGGVGGADSYDTDGGTEQENFVEFRCWKKSRLHLRIPRLFGKFCKISENELYIVGGIGFNANQNLTSLAAIDYFNFDMEKWQYFGDMHSARHGHDIAALNERIIIIGGVSTIKNKTLTKVESFCTKTRKCFKDVSRLPWPLSGGAVVIME